MRMNWLRAHPIPVILLVASVLVLIGSSIVRERVMVTPSRIVAWSGTSGSPQNMLTGLNPFENAGKTPPASPGLLREVANDTPFSYVFPAPAKNAPSGPVTPAPPQPAEPKTSRSPIASNAALDYALSFIPHGRIGTIVPQTAARTPEQKALFEYGNAAGESVQSFENTHRNMVQTLKAFFDDRTNPSKAQKVLDLANDFSALAGTLQRMSAIPPEISAAHAALAQSYGSVATGLTHVAEVPRESDMIEAIKAYDATAGVFIKNYVAIVELFSAYGVKFSATDPGSVFAFSLSSGL